MKDKEKEGEEKDVVLEKQRGEAETLREQIRKTNGLMKVKDQEIKIWQDDKQKILHQVEKVKKLNIDLKQVNENMARNKENRCDDERNGKSEVADLKEKIQIFEGVVGKMKRDIADKEENELKLCRNLSELVEELRSRGEEIKSKDEKIDQISQVIDRKTNTEKRLEENIQQLREENIKMKNTIKQVQQNKNEHQEKNLLLAEFKQLKRFVEKEVGAVKEEQASLKSNIQLQTKRESKNDGRKITNFGGGSLRYHNNGGEEPGERTSDDSLSDQAPLSRKCPNFRERKSSISHERRKGDRNKTSDFKTRNNLQSKDEVRRKNVIVKQLNQNRVLIDPDSDAEFEYATKRKVPGEHLYSDKVKGLKTTMVFSTSITKGINVQEFNDAVVNGRAEFHKFRGKKAQHIKHYIKSHLSIERPDRVVIHIGGNDLPPGPNLSS